MLEIRSIFHYLYDPVTRFRKKHVAKSVESRTRTENPMIGHFARSLFSLIMLRLRARGQTPTPY